jgi:hypothetical protein
MPNCRLSKEKRKKIWGGYAVSAPICQTFKTNKIMETVKLQLSEWFHVLMAIKREIKNYKNVELNEEAERMQETLNKMKKTNQRNRKILW